MRIILISTFLVVSRLCIAQFGLQNNLVHPTYSASSVLTTDADGDGDMDVISSSYSELTLFENPGNSLFQMDLIHVIPASLANGNKYVTTFDFDNDGDPDILAASVPDQTIAVFENLGNCAFGPQIVVNTAIPSVSHLNVSDMDNDGLADIVVTSANYIDWIKNTGNWSFGNEAHITSLPNQHTAIEVADTDNDNLPDILWGGTLSPNFSKIKNLGNGAFSASALISNQSYYLFHIESCDINGDAYPDLLTADYYGVKKFINNGSGGFAAPVLIQTVESCRFASMLDMDDDGDKDIVWSKPAFTSGQQEIYWSRNNGSENYTTGYPFAISTHLEGDLDVSIDDLDGDGDKDVVTSTSVDGIVACSINIADTTFEAKRLISSSVTGVSSVVSADFDNDGSKDIVSASPDGKVSYFKNYGDGHFAIQRILYDQLDWVGETGSSNLRAGDMDQDGDIDIVAFCAYHSYTNGNNPTKFYWLENTGNEQFIYHQLYAATQSDVLESGYTDLELADTDLDGDLDILTSHRDAHLIRLYTNLGNGSFGGAVNLTFIMNCYRIRLADMDNDGLSDIVSGSASLSWYKNLGSNTFGTEQLVAENIGQISSLEVADINGDGTPDILSGNNFTATSSWYANSGNGSFGPEHIIHTEEFYPQMTVHAADLDDDGDQDVLAVGSWHENTGNGVFGTPQALGTGGMGFGTFLTTDLDNDGDPEIIGDILWFENLLMDEGNISGHLFADMDQDGIFGTGDTGIGYASVFATPESDFTYSFQDGHYVIHLSDELGGYLIEPGSIPHWSITTDSSSYHVTLSDSSNYENLDFGFSPLDTVHELAPLLTGGFPRCNTIVNYWLDLKNTGTTIPSGIIHLELDPAISYVSSATAPDSINGQHLYWHYDSLLYFSHQQLNLQVQMPNFTAMGDTLISYLTATITDTTGASIASFTDELSQILVCAYDPNDKTVEPVGADAPGYIPMSTDWMEYTIRFQNTGNDTAMQVLITDQLDADLNWQSLQPLAQSHPITISVDQYGLVSFLFEAIHLPDSNTNELASHGFIRYRILLDSGLTNGTQITNTASIYFDQNPAVLTNVTLNTLQQCPSIGIDVQPLTTLCEGDVVDVTVYNLPQTAAISWIIYGVEEQTGEVFHWVTDTTGGFDLHLIVDNGICDIDLIEQLSVNENPSAHLTGPEADTICLQDGSVTLPEGIPTGGIFSGNGVWNNSFNPAVSGTGNQAVTYTVSNGACSASDFITITVEDCLGIDEMNGNQLLIFPNPASAGNGLTIQWMQEPTGRYDLTLENIVGETVYSQPHLSGSTQLISLPDIGSGVYWLRIKEDSGRTVTQQLVID